MQSISPTILRKALGEFPTGVTVVAVKAAGIVHGATVASFMGVSLDPPIVLVSLQRRAKIARAIQERPFSISILAHDQEWLARHFAGEQALSPIPWCDHDNSLIEGATVHIKCAPWQQQIVGDHLVVFGRVTAIQIPNSPPLVYHRGDTSTKLTQREVKAHYG